MFLHTSSFLPHRIFETLSTDTPIYNENFSLTRTISDTLHLFISSFLNHVTKSQLIMASVADRRQVIKLPFYLMDGMPDDLLTPRTALMFEEQTSETKFTLFSKLHAEIRCMIWAATFRPRIVALNLEYQFAEHDYFNTLDYPEIRIAYRNYTPHPITMFVNQESRTTTLLHYIVPFTPNPSNFILFHPALDSVAIVFSSFGMDNNLEIYKWYHVSIFTRWNCPDLLQNLRSLTLPYTSTVDNSYELNIEDDRSLQEYVDNHDLFKFKNLEELIIIGDMEQMITLPNIPRITFARRLKEFIEEGFRRRRLADDSCKVPKIIIVYRDTGSFRLPVFRDELEMPADGAGDP